MKIELEELLEQNIRATRAGNLIRLAQSMGLNASDPESRAKAKRQLHLIEAEFEGGDRD